MVAQTPIQDAGSEVAGALSQQHLDELERQAWLATTQRAKPGLVTLPIACAVLVLVSPLAQTHTLAAAAVVGLALAISAIRAFWMLDAERRHDANPQRYRTAFTIGVAAAVAVYSALAAEVLVTYGAGWSSTAALMISAAIASIGVVAYSPVLPVMHAFGVTLFLVHLAGAIRMSGTVGLVMAAAFFAYALHSLMLGRSLSREFHQALRDAKLLELQATELEAARVDAELASEAKSMFLANTSHEIRTPLNGVLGMTRVLLMESDLEPHHRDRLETVQRSGEILLAVINDILDFSKSEAGEMELNPVPFAVPEQFIQTCELYRGTAEERGVELSCDVTPGQWYALGDAVRLRQVVSNLTSNALKFTEQGTVQVTCHCARRDGRIELRCEVIDTGIGIPAEKCDGLFQAFAQIDGSSSRRYGGTGLGLAICRQLVELMEGEIGVESTQGTGSTFWFTLSLPAAAAPPKKPVVSATPGEALREGRILLVEDNRINQMVALALLKKLGFEADVTNNGKEALAAFESNRYEAILMDVHMPEMDGIEATRRIRASGAEGASVPIIALTASALDRDREQCLEAGMNAHLAKPLNVSDLTRALDRVWNAHE